MSHPTRILYRFTSCLNKKKSDLCVMYGLIKLLGGGGGEEDPAHMDT